MSSSSLTPHLTRKENSPAQDFRGPARALSHNGLAAATEKLGTSPAEIWTVLAVETAGCGFLPDRRPQVLFERHIFHRLTGGQYDDGFISHPEPGGYGSRGSFQFERLARAVTLDRCAALQSASWGIGQILGMNYRSAGFKNIEEMVIAMGASEDQQLAAMAALLLANGLHTAFRAHAWTSFARAYNGPSYARNRYDVRLAETYVRYSSAPLPDLSVRAAQLYLTYLGLGPGPIDGVPGPRTRSALATFESTHRCTLPLPITAETVEHLYSAVNSHVELVSSNT